MRIGIAGAGGIGSNVARYLVQAGVSDLLVVDFDRVERSNLNRQFYTVAQEGRFKADCLKENLEGICPGVSVATVNRRLLPGEAGEVFKGCGMVVEGLDDAAAKKFLVEDLALADIPMVCASGIAGTQMDTVRIRSVGRIRVVGDFSSDMESHGLFPPKIGLITAMMAGIVLDYVQERRTGEKNEPQT